MIASDRPLEPLKSQKNVAGKMPKKMHIEYELGLLLYELGYLCSQVMRLLLLAVQ